MSNRKYKVGNACNFDSAFQNFVNLVHNLNSKVISEQAKKVGEGGEAEHHSSLT